MRLSIVVRALVCYDAFDHHYPNVSLRITQRVNLPMLFPMSKYTTVCVCVIMFINVRQHFLHTLVFVS